MVFDGYPGTDLWWGRLDTTVQAIELVDPLLPCPDCGMTTVHGLFKKPGCPSLGTVCSRCGRVTEPHGEPREVPGWPGPR